MAGQGAALRDWVASRRLSANQVDGRVLAEIGGIFEMALQPVSVVRPDDLLMLEFRFVNLRRQGGKLVRGRGAGPALLIVAHQFQSVGEEAFPEITDAGQQGFEADPKLKGRNPPADPGVTVTDLPAQARVRAAGESRTVHTMPQGHPGIDWTLPALLAAVRDWPLALDGSETYDVVGERTPRAILTLVVHRRSGETLQVPVTCRLDTAEELSIYEAGGVLQRFAQDFLESSVRK